ncbi:dTDP-4-dehydrorhamnose 3,5-epimerase [Rossellomorea marisflavi]|uniref:dTDP-4-dehydrorhamnose 3,5-epimerase n=1 Tax=Rossellomorea marisflavi TaxID=189381 RepID=A0A0M0G084_9BACI|nr:dTDP-4-dehydrorhamnose 3,5-epimerase [Rossellomorea marisflavi]KON82891.1 dTDP-4-dehydrorhamnose 3,5-epimerase [Rossellomorea marisflavi]
MIFKETSLTGVFILEPSLFGDHRGWFMETFSDSEFKQMGIHLNFVQDNHSFSAERGTLRGMHYQLDFKAQTKLVRCTRGAIYDVAVDIRIGSPNYGKWVGVELTSENKKQLLVPKGFAHGFITLVENVEVQYKVDEFYAPECDRGIIWDDPEINIEWPIDVVPILSEKDKKAPLLKDAENNFSFTV